MGAAIGRQTPLHGLLSDIWERHRANPDGDIATYIPELANANPDWFGISLVTLDGASYDVGDSNQPFTIQSISKPFAYGLALELGGPDEVSRRVGVEPSGDAFNSISLQQGTGRPLNPMINAGAIAISSLINDRIGANALPHTLEWFSRFAGRELTIDQRIYESERSTGHRNRAIAHLLRNFDIVGDAVEQGLDLYFRQCSILVTCHDLAVMAATLANHGVNPVTGVRAMASPSPEWARGHVEDVLSIMTTCGMYNYAGQWLYDVGVPAKSGVAGGILAVLPGRMGIAAFSPKLDVQGNSVRGVKACHELSQRFGLHLFSAHRPGRSVIRSETTLQSRASSRVRPKFEAQRLKSEGESVLLLELQGDLHFSAMERVQRRVWDRLDQATTIVFDFARVDAIDAAVVAGVSLLTSKLLGTGRQVVFSSLNHSPRGVELAHAAAPSATYVDFDSALEACEDSLLRGRPVGVTGKNGDDTTLKPTLAVAELDVAEGLDENELRQLQGLLIRHRAEAGQAIFHMGDAANELYFLSRGTVSVRLPSTASGAAQRLAVFGAGSVFGEVAVIDHGSRSADVWTETPAEYYSLSVQAFDGLDADHPSLKIKILRYLLKMITFRLRRANDLIGQIGR